MSSLKKFGAGLSSIQHFGSGVSLLGVTEFDPTNSIHATLSLLSTSPFQFTVGGTYKHVIARQGNAGIHLGPGIALGSVRNGIQSRFLVTVSGVAGIRVSFPGAENVQIHLDGGPVLQLLDGSANFSLGGLSGLLGMSIYYLF